ncbi:MAG: hypothetical protein WCC53_03645 [Thermoanaerobaculia bacterium]
MAPGSRRSPCGKEPGIRSPTGRSTFRGERALLSAAAALAAFSAAFLLQVVAWPEIVASAWHVARGFRLYDNVIEPYTPVLILLAAWLGRLVGFGPTVFRTLAGLPLAACALLAVSAARGRRARWTAALLGPPLLVLWCVYFEGPALWPDPFVAPLLLAAGLQLLRFERTGNGRAADLAGLLLGLAILVKQTSAWALLMGALWCLISSRRAPPSRAARLFLVGCVPYMVFAAAWAIVGRTTAHVRWTLLVPLLGHAAEIGLRPDGQDLLETIGPALAIPAVWLLVRGLTRHRLRTSPLAWLAAGAALMTIPRWGLLHLSGATGLVVVLSLDGLRAVRPLVSPRFRRATRGSLVYAACGVALLATHLGVAAFGAGPLVGAAWGRGARFWDDTSLQSTARVVAERVPPGGTFLNYFATSDNVYPLTGTFAPGGLYVNASFWFFLNKDDLDARLVAAVESRPDTLVLFREPEGGWTTPARETRLYRFLAAQTVPVGRVDAETSWRAMREAPR